MSIEDKVKLLRQKLDYWISCDSPQTLDRKQKSVHKIIEEVF